MNKIGKYCQKNCIDPIRQILKCLIASIPEKFSRRNLIKNGGAGGDYRNNNFDNKFDQGNQSKYALSYPNSVRIWCSKEI